MAKDREHLREKYKTLVSQWGEPSPKGSNHIGQGLELVLRGELPATYIKVINCQECHYDRETYGTTEDYDWGMNIRRLEGGNALQVALESITWVSHDERVELSEGVMAGDEEAALCVLLPMLTGLKVLKTFTVAPRIHRFVANLARDLPAGCLPNLELVWAPPSNGEVGLSIEKFSGYAALPSVRTIVAFQSMSRSRSGDFQRWPTDLPQSRVNRVSFRNACVVRADVEKWAEGFRGPCIMTQNWSRCDGYPTEYPEGAMTEPDWDFLVISGEVDRDHDGLLPGTRHVDISLRGEGADQEVMGVDEGVDWPDV